MGQNLAESFELAQLQALVNQLNQVTPFGNMTFSGPTIDTRFGPMRDPTNTTATTTLSPQLQALFNQQVRGQRQAGQAGLSMLGDMSGGPVFGGRVDRFQAPGQQVGQFSAPGFGPASSPGINNPFNLLNMMRGNTDFSAERDRVEGATFDRAMSLLNPELERREDSLRQRLANQGLPQASRAATAELGRFEDTSNRVREQAAMAAILAGGQEQSRLLSDLLGTSNAGINQAMANRQQRFGENLQGFGANLMAQGQGFNQALQGFGADLQRGQFNMDRAQMNRQMPFQEMLSLFQLGSGLQQQPFFAPGQTQVQNMASMPGQGSMPFGQQLALGGIGALGNIGAGLFSGGLF